MSIETLVLLILSVSLFLSVPTAAPESVTTPSVTFSTITVQWGVVPCIHQNGPITAYSVRYGVMRSGSTQTETVFGASETETIISDLMPSTTYVVQVAAVNGNGTGVYSSNEYALTQSIYYCSFVDDVMYIHCLHSCRSNCDGRLYNSYLHLPLLDN